uniref:Cyclic nucleotide-binding domain-containing protein n=1 Tax=Guillardia theta TaxID=55529 RepID=A0A7S4KFN9_GUITH|mmetsp:Transcript_24167/g.78767  ORF Transcript_24167/g.78767 Transcript_24167/m.78767 type:complete len:336 (+) Transcript_24167:443-1450(+)
MEPPERATITVGPGEEIVRSGDAIEGFYLLLAGECDLVVRVSTENALTRRVEEEERFLLASSMMKLRESCIQVRSSSDCKFEWAPASSLLHSGSSGVESDVNKCISMLQQMFKGVSRCTCALILEYSRIRRIHAGASLALDGRTTSTVVLLEGQCIAAREGLRCGLLQGLQLLPLTSRDVAVRLDAVTSCLLMVMERQREEDMSCCLGDLLPLKQLLSCGHGDPPARLSSLIWTFNQRPARPPGRTPLARAAAAAGGNAEEEKVPPATSPTVVTQRGIGRTSSLRPSSVAGTRRLCWLSTDVLEPTLHYEQLIPLMSRKENIEHVAPGDACDDRA